MSIPRRRFEAGLLALAKADQRLHGAVDGKTGLSFDPASVYVFDTSTGARVRG